MPDTRILACIDDDQYVREALEGLLRSVGYPAAMFESAEDFLQSPGISGFSCLITDMRLSGISGLQLLKRLSVEGHALPAIIITAFGDEQLREESLAAGAIGFLHKPIREAELLGLLAAAVGRPAH